MTGVGLTEGGGAIWWGCIADVRRNAIDSGGKLLDIVERPRPLPSNRSAVLINNNSGGGDGHEASGEMLECRHTHTHTHIHTYSYNIHSP